MTKSGRRLPFSLKAGQVLSRARRWRPRGDAPAHRLLAAEIDLRSGAFKDTLDTLAPLTG